MKLNKLLYPFVFQALLNLFSCKSNTLESHAIDATDVIQDFKKHIDANRVLTKVILDSTADDDLEMKVIANINSKFNENFTNKSEVLPILSTEQQTIYYIYLVETAVNNGGFDQFYMNNFINSDEAYLFEKTVPAFASIGAVYYADIVKRANEVFNNNKKNFIDTTGLFNKLDQEFYDGYEKENLADLKVNYIRSHTVAFITK